MKSILTAMVSLFFVTAHSQKILINETDKFTHQHVIETNNISLRRTISVGISIKFRSVDHNYFINLSGEDAQGIIDKDEIVLFLLDNDSTITITSTGPQAYELRTGAGNSIQKRYSYQYFISKENIEQLAAHSVKSVRIYYTDSYWDMDVSKQSKDNLKDLSNLFLNEIEK